MTDRKDFKRRVRERAERTGESYTTARAQLLAQRPESPPAVPVVELEDVSDLAAALGLRCRVHVSAAVTAQVAAPRVVALVSTALTASDSLPEADLMRRVVLYGERPPALFERGRVIGDLRSFFARARAGLGGFARNGFMLAMHVDGVPVIVTLMARAYPVPVTRDTSLMIATMNEELGSFGLD